MQFVTDGPIIPTEVLRAYEERRLVFFCGAGISLYTDVPEFKGLVKHLSDTCRVPIADAGEQTVGPRDRAFQQADYDLALELLERALPDPAPMRRAAIDRLTKPFDGVLRLHQALLGLSGVTGGGYRLVTTNYDNRFHLAGADPIWSQAGPRLAPPRNDHWRHLTYLHGLIDRQADPDGQHLVMTAGDFGRAYLQDGWAARFVVELFRHYTVLFVGYSLNDPVMRYLVAALAAEVGAPGGFRRAFALTGYERNDQEKIENDWRAKGVEPIPYLIRSGQSGQAGPDHALLEDTLVEWATIHTAGLDGRISVALRIGDNPCQDPGGPDVISLAWALSKPDGSVAKAFADADCVPDISWLTALHGLEAQAEADQSPKNERDQPASPPTISALLYNHAPRLARLTPVANELGRWLTKHMESTTLVDWVNDGGAVVHDDWARHLGNRLEGAGPPVQEPFAAYWRIVLSGATQVPERPPGARGNGYGLSRHLPMDLWMARLLASLRPYLTPKPHYVPREWLDELAPRLRDLVRFELRLAGRQAAWQGVQERRNDGGLRALLARQVDSLTSLLVAALHMGRRGEVLDTDDGPNWVGDEPRGDFEDWGVLICICRIAFDAALEHLPGYARTTRARWCLLGVGDDLPLLRRLALYGYTTDADTDPTPGLDLLLSNQAAMLWDFRCWAEVAVFLRTRAGQLDQDARERLFAGITAGPPDGESDDADDRVTRRAYKLAEAGIALSESLRQRIGAHEPASSDQSPAPRPDERRSYLLWSGFIEPETAGSLRNRTPEEICEHVARRSTQDRWQAANILADLGRSDPLVALAVVRCLIKRGLGSESYLGAAFRGLGVTAADPELLQDVFRDFTALTREYPDWTAGHGLAALCAALPAFARQLGPDADQDCGLLDLWRVLWQAVKDEAPAPGEPEQDESASQTPAGELTQTLLERLRVRRPRGGLGLPSDLRPLFDEAAGGEGEPQDAARVVLAARLPPLYAIDPPWCENNLLRRMNGEYPAAPRLWREVLWSGAWPPDLVRALEPAIRSLASASAWRRLDTETTGRIAERLAGILVEQAPGMLKDATVHGLITRMSAEDLAGMAGVYEDALKRAGEKAASLWRERIADTVWQFWPGDARRRSRETAFELADMALATREALPEALKLLNDRALLAHASHIGQLLFRIDGEAGEQEHYDVVREHPEAVLDLLNRCCDDHDATAYGQEILAVLKRIVGKSPGLGSDSRLQRLRDLARSP